MQVNSITGSYYLDDRSTEQPVQTLDRDAFLEILVNQLRYQNPMDPQDSDSFITQMVQLSTMEQLAKLTTSIEKMIDAEEFSRAVSLIGCQIDIYDDNGSIATGTVEKVIMVDGEPRLVLEDNDYPLSNLISINLPPDNMVTVQPDQGDSNPEPTQVDEAGDTGDETGEINTTGEGTGIESTDSGAEITDSGTEGAESGTESSGSGNSDSGTGEL